MNVCNHRRCLVMPKGGSFSLRKQRKRKGHGLFARFETFRNADSTNYVQYIISLSQPSTSVLTKNRAHFLYIITKCFSGFAHFATTKSFTHLLVRLSPPAPSSRCVSQCYETSPIQKKISNFRSKKYHAFEIFDLLNCIKLYIFLIVYQNIHHFPLFIPLPMLFSFFGVPKRFSEKLRNFFPALLYFCKFTMV